MSHQENALNDAGDLSPEQLPLLALTPFTTSAPITWNGLQTSVHERFRSFVNYLAYTNKELKSSYWGGIPAAEVLKGTLETRLDNSFRNRGDGKLLPIYTLPMVEYIGAYRFLDHLARVEGTAQVSRDVLKQPAREGLVGKQIHTKCLSDLDILLKEFLSVADLCKTYLAQNGSKSAAFSGSPVTVDSSSAHVSSAGVSEGRHASVHKTSDPLFTIAAELNATVVGKKAMKIIRNFDAVALSVRLMMQGSCLSIPDSYEEVLSLLPYDAQPETSFEKRQLQEAMKDPRGLRQAFRLVFLISPLLVLSSSRQLEKYSACPTELLLNCKRIGNCKPQVIEEWEDAVMRGILLIAEGKQTASQTLVQMADSWRQSPPHLTPEDKQYFSHILLKSDSTSYDPKMSLLDTIAISPYPTSWPLTPAILSYIGSSCIQELITTSQQSSTTPNSPGSPLTSVAPSAPQSRSASPVPIGGDDSPEDDQAGTGEQMEQYEPRRSKRERKPPAPPEETSGRVPPRGNKGHKRPHADVDVAEEEGDEAMEEGGGDGEVTIGSRNRPTPNVRLVHGNAVKKRQELLEESILKMEEIEPPIVNFDVDDATPRLVIGEPVERYSDIEPFTFDAWGADGRKETLSLQCHSQDDFEALKFIIGEIKAQLCPSGRPRFLDEPDKSVLRLLRPEFYTKDNARALHSIYARQSIVIPDYSKLRVNWDVSGMEYAGDPAQDTSLQDFSVPVLSGNYNDRLRIGSLNQLLAVSMAPPDTRKHLSALFLPQPNGHIDPNDPLATDAKAWWKTKSEAQCLKDMPGRDMRWAIVGTSGSMHFFHVDPRGDGTFILPLVGLKAWILAMPIDESVLLSAELWTKLELDITKLDFTKWKVEMILLRPGDLLIQMPHVSHAVYTPRDSICSGGHLIAMGALRRSLVGVIHTFFCQEIINIDHPTFACRLNSIVCFLYKAFTSESVSDTDAAHLMDIYSVSGIEDLLLLTCVIELQNALCPLSYQPTTDQTLLALLHKSGLTGVSALQDYDVSAMPHDMRAQNVFSRGRMQATLRCVLRRVSIFTDQGEMQDPWKELFIPVLAHFVECMKTYHSLAFDHLLKAKKSKKKAGDSLLTIPRGLFLVQMRSTTLRWDPILKDAVKAAKGKRVTTFLPPDLCFRVEKKADSSDIGTSESAPDFRELGMRTLDGLYFTLYNALITSGGTGSIPKGETRDPGPTDAGTDSAAAESTTSGTKRRRVKV